MEKNTSKTTSIVCWPEGFGHCFWEGKEEIKKYVGTHVKIIRLIAELLRLFYLSFMITTSGVTTIILETAFLCNALINLGNS